MIFQAFNFFRNLDEAIKRMNMKKICFILVFTYFIPNLNAQGWCTPGSTWYYEIPFPASGYAKHTYLYDTLVGANMCNKIKVEEFGTMWGGAPINYLNYIYTFYQNGIVFKNNGTLSAPHYDTLYYFNGPVGAKWRCNLTDFTGNPASCSQSFIEITGTGSAIIQGQTINWRKIAYTNYFQGNPSSGVDTLFERIGTRHNMEFISGYHCADATDVGPLPFRCFSDNQISIQSSTVACDYTTGVPEVKKPERTLTFLQPSNDILVGRFVKDDYDLKLIDALGKTVYLHHFNVNNFSVNVFGFTQGIYYLEVSSENLQIREKVLIHH
jgi:hypothetical protein